MLFRHLCTLCFTRLWLTSCNLISQRVELPLVISDHCDWPELIETIHETGASEVWVTHGRDEALVHYCQKVGLQARALSLLGYEDEAGE